MKNDIKNIFTKQLNMDGATHSTLLVVIGGYLVYMAYQMVRDTLNGLSSMDLTTTVILAGIMALAGLAVVAYGAGMALKAWRKKNSGQTEETADEE